MKFKLNKKETEDYKNFKSDHWDCNGSIDIAFFNTGVGTKIEVHCSGCDEVEDITDYSSW